MTPILGLHHVTVTSSFGGPLMEFFRGRLGLRLVKRTVNFDDPSMWHLYFADEVGTPGSVITHFPVGAIPPGVRGRGEIAEAAYAVPHDRFGALAERLAKLPGAQRRERFGEHSLALRDADGSGVAITAVDTDDPRISAFTARASDPVGLGGLSGVTITVGEAAPLRDVLVGALGLSLFGTDEGVERVQAGPATIDIEVAPERPIRRRGAGTIHHVALAVEGDAALMDISERLRSADLDPTPIRERIYFRSVYCLMPGGALFEFATAGPGFMVDETREALGSSICLPPWLEAQRDEIIAQLPELPT